MSENPPESHELLVAKDAAKNAARVLMQYFRQANPIDFKSPYNLVSQADLDAQKAIQDTIKTAFPADAILGEESIESNDPEGTEVNGDRLWIVDPLDGTNNFCHGLDHFAVSIGFYDRGIPTVGVVFRPTSNDWYVAEAGSGAYHNEKKCRVADFKDLNQALVGTGFFYDRGDQMRRTLAAIESHFEKNIHGIRRMGTASLDLCMVGAGMFGGYFEFELAPWDYAAGKLFVEEAGGVVTDCQGASFSQGKSSIIAACPGLHESMLGLVKPHYEL